MSSIAAFVDSSLHLLQRHTLRNSRLKTIQDYLRGLAAIRWKKYFNNYYTMFDEAPDTPSKLSNTNDKPIEVNLHIHIFHREMIHLFNQQNRFKIPESPFPLNLPYMMPSINPVYQICYTNDRLLLETNKTIKITNKI